MTTEKKMLCSIVVWCTFFIIPLWSITLWAVDGNQYLWLYWIVAGGGSIFSFFLFLFRKQFLFWYFVAGTLALFSTLTFGLILINGALLNLAFNIYLSPNLVMITNLLVYTTYSIVPLKYYHNDYHQSEKDRLKSFDFLKGTYDITHQSIVRGDAFADFYAKSFLSKAHTSVIRMNILFPISGGAVAIIAGNISRNLQLGIGIIAVFLTIVLLIQGFSLGFFNAWKVFQLEKQHGKKIRILWGDESEKTSD